RSLWLTAGRRRFEVGAVRGAVATWRSRNDYLRGSQVATAPRTAPQVFSDSSATKIRPFAANRGRDDDGCDSAQSFARLPVALHRAIRLGVRLGDQLRRAAVANVPTDEIHIRGWDVGRGRVCSDVRDGFRGWRDGRLH